MTSFSCAVSRCAGTLRWKALSAVALLAVTACSGMGDAMSAHTDVVARAAGNELRVEDAAAILASNPQIPPDPEVVRALAELWVDYALLGTAVAEDTTLAAVDLESFTQPVREQAIMTKLRQQVVEVDTVFDDAELERRWAVEGPGAEIHARHILLRTPTNGTQAQRDSVRQRAEELRARAVSGESFADLARQYSEDPGSAANGGDLGFFSRGRMVQPFEDVAFQLEPGEISQVVETPFGYHIIQVEERRQPEIGDNREPFRQFLVQQAVQQAEVAYLDSLSTEAGVEIPDESLEVVRGIAANPDRELTGRQASREIATYTGGEYTAGEFSEFVRSQPPQVQGAFGSATDEQLEGAVRQLVQMELLLVEAQKRDITLDAEETEQIQSQARDLIHNLVDATGFAQAARQGATPEALNDHVTALVRATVNGETEFVPLGRLGISLRDLYPYEINEDAFADVVSQVEAIRAQQPPPPPSDSAAPPMPMDSAAAAVPGAPPSP